jgi:hypothetical protein
MFDTIPTLDRKGLRDFGLITGGLFAAIFGLLLPWKFAWDWPLWPWLLFAVLGGMALFAPLRLEPVYRLWMRFGMAIGAVMSRIILGLVFFCVVTPVGLLMRATGKDPMRRRFDPDAASYREPSGTHKSDSLDKPF